MNKYDEIINYLKNKSKSNIKGGGVEDYSNEFILKFNNYEYINPIFDFSANETNDEFTLNFVIDNILFINYEITFKFHDNYTFNEIFNNLVINFKINNNINSVNDIKNPSQELLSKLNTNKKLYKYLKYLYYINNKEKYDTLNENENFIDSDLIIDFKKYNENIYESINKLIKFTIIELIAINYYFFNSIFYIIYELWLMYKFYKPIDKSNDLKDVINPNIKLLEYKHYTLKYAMKYTLEIYDKINNLLNIDNFNLSLSDLYFKLSNQLLVPTMFDSNAGDCWINALACSYYYNKEKYSESTDYNNLYNNIKYLYNNADKPNVDKNDLIRILLYKIDVDKLRFKILQLLINYNHKHSNLSFLHFKDLFNNILHMALYILPDYMIYVNNTQIIQTNEGPHNVFKIRVKDKIKLYDLNDLHDYCEITIKIGTVPLYKGYLKDYQDMNDICKNIIQNSITVSSTNYLSYKYNDIIYIQIEEIINDIGIYYYSDDYKLNKDNYITSKMNKKQKTLMIKIINYLNLTMIYNSYDISKKLYKFLNKYCNYCNKYNICIKEYDELINIYNSILQNDNISLKDYTILRKYKNITTEDITLNFCYKLYIKYLPLLIYRLLPLFDFKHLEIPKLPDDKYLLIANMDDTYIISTTKTSNLPYIKHSMRKASKDTYNHLGFNSSFEFYREFMITKTLGKYYLFNFGDIILKNEDSEINRYPILKDINYLYHNWYEYYTCSILGSHLYDGTSNILLYDEANEYMNDIISSNLNIYTDKTTTNIKQFYAYNQIIMYNTSKLKLDFEGFVPIKYNDNKIYYLGGNNLVFNNLNWSFILIFFIVLIIIIVIIVIIKFKSIHEV